MAQIDHTKPSFDDKEVDALKTLIKTRRVNEGDLAHKLVDNITQFVNACGGVATSTGTLGLHLCLKALGVESENDEVIIPDFSCRSLFDCIRMAGGTPIFCDINLEDYSLSIDSVKPALSKKTKAIILPHMYGCPANLDSFLNLEIPVIEDCAHSMGASYKGRPVGSFGVFSVFSLEGSKIISVGEGGVVLANEGYMLDQLKTLRYGLQGRFAYHYRLSDLAASVALIQINKLPFMLERRKYIANYYRYKLRRLEEEGILKLPQVLVGRDSVYYRFVIVCNSKSESLVRFANDKGILIRNPLPSGCLSDTFKDFGFHNKNANILAQNGASLPIYPDLDDDEMSKVAHVVESFYEMSYAL